MSDISDWELAVSLLPAVHNLFRGWVYAVLYSTCGFSVAHMCICRDRPMPTSGVDKDRSPDINQLQRMLPPALSGRSPQGGAKTTRQLGTDQENMHTWAISC